MDGAIKMKNFSIDDIVKYPENIGYHSEIIGKVVGINKNINYDLNKTPFIWIEILDLNLDRKMLVASHKLKFISKG